MKVKCESDFVHSDCGALNFLMLLLAFILGVSDVV